MKTCTICNETKDESEFSKDISSKDGLQKRCKPCDGSYRKELRVKLSTGELPHTQVTFKICNQCGEYKSASEFHKNRTNKDGLNAQCKICANINYKLRRSKKSVRYGLVDLRTVPIVDEIKRANILKEEFYNDDTDLISIANLHRKVIVNRVVSNNPKFTLVEADNIIVNKLK